MTDWLFLLLKFIDMIIKNHLKVSPIGTAPLLHQGTFGDLTYPYRVGLKMVSFRKKWNSSIKR